MKNIMQNYSDVALKLNPYQWEAGIMENSLRFDTNTLPFPPSGLKTFFEEMIRKCPINEYPDPSYTNLKKLIAEYEKVNANMITVTNSGDEAIDILAKTFLNPGDYFITTPPTFEMFDIQCGINRGVNFPIPLKNTTWEINTEQIIKQSRNPKVKLIFLVNPNNPTASIIPESELIKIIKNSKSIVVIDEVYREFYGKSAVKFLQKYQNLVILRSFSKFAALAGARVGYLISNEKFAQKFNAIRFPMGVSFLSYKLAEFVLKFDQKSIKKQVNIIKNQRIKLKKDIENLGFKVFPSYSNFLLVNFGDKASQVCLKLKNKGIIVRDRSNKKYLEGCVRITVRSPFENSQLIKSLKEIIYEKK